MYDVLIVGGGASGLAAACALAEPGRLRVAVLEKQPRVGRKLLSTCLLYTSTCRRSGACDGRQLAPSPPAKCSR